jgi:hypothetical protein
MPPKSKKKTTAKKKPINKNKNILVAQQTVNVVLPAKPKRKPKKKDPPYEEPNLNPGGRGTAGTIRRPYLPVVNSIPSPYAGGMVPDYVTDAARQLIVDRLLNRYGDPMNDLRGVKDIGRDAEPTPKSEKKNKPRKEQSSDPWRNQPSASGSEADFRFVSNPLYEPPSPPKQLTLADVPSTSSGQTQQKYPKLADVGPPYTGGAVVNAEGDVKFIKGWTKTGRPITFKEPKDPKGKGKKE